MPNVYVLAPRYFTKGQAGEKELYEHRYEGWTVKAGLALCLRRRELLAKPGGRMAHPLKDRAELSVSQEEAWAWRPLGADG